MSGRLRNTRPRSSRIAGALVAAALPLGAVLALQGGPVSGASFPNPTAVINSPASGGTYTFGEDVPTSFTCTEGAGGPGLLSCDDSNGVASVAGGTGALNTQTVGVGLSYTVTATSTDAEVGTSAAFTYTVTAANQTINFTTTAPNSAGVGSAPYIPNALSSSFLPVTLTLDALSTGCSIAPNHVVTYTAIGTCLIDANQAGNTDFNAAPQVQQRIVVTKGQSVITLTSFPPASAAVGSHYTPSARSTSKDAVQIMLDAASKGCTLMGGVVTFTADGSCIVDFNDPGNANWGPALQVQQTTVLSKHAVTIKVVAAPDRAAKATSITLTATASTTSATGVIIFMEKSFRLCSATLHGGKATCKIARSLPKGSYRVYADYSGNSVDAAAKGTTTFQVT
jgi:hypothetical protein